MSPAEGSTPAGAGSRWATQLTAINAAKLLTIVLLLVLAALIGVNDGRQALYLSLHISYCLWWLLEQWLFPERRRLMFPERVGPVGFVFALLFVGVLYSLPGLLAFLNPVPISHGAVALAVGLFSFGSLSNASADGSGTLQILDSHSSVTNRFYRAVRGLAS